MKFSLFALPALFLGAMAAPAAADSSLEKRADKEAQAIAIVESAYSSIKQYTGALNETAESITPSSSVADKEAAVKSANVDLAEIATALNSAKSQIQKLSTSKLARRQSQGNVNETQQLASDLENLLMEIGGSLKKIQSSLGSLSGNLNPEGVLTAVYGVLQAVGTVAAMVLSTLEDLLNALNETSTSIIPGLTIPPGKV